MSDANNLFKQQHFKPKIIILKQFSPFLDLIIHIQRSRCKYQISMKATIQLTFTELILTYKVWHLD